MATAPKGDDPDVRHSVSQAMAREVARRRMATRGGRPSRAAKPKKLKATYSLAQAMPK